MRTVHAVSAQTSEVRDAASESFGRVSGMSASVQTWRQVDRPRWDTFGLDHGASFRGTSGHVLGWVVKRRLRARARFVEVWEGPPESRRKAGQVAVALTRSGGVFLDRIALGDGVSWQSVMAAALLALPDGSYLYGWELNVEPAREDDLQSIRGVQIDDVRPLVVHAVEFARWPGWDDYHRSISTNIKRNAKRAVTQLPDLEVDVTRGLRALTRVPALVRMRAGMYSRKGMAFDPVRASVNTAANLLVTASRTSTQVARSQGKPFAALHTIEYGSCTWYMDGGSISDNQGTGWYLLVSALNRAYDRAPEGLFVMGYLDPSTHEEAVGGGLVRSRRSCRVSDLETSIVRFTWHSDSRP